MGQGEEDLSDDLSDPAEIFFDHPPEFSAPAAETAGGYLFRAEKISPEPPEKAPEGDVSTRPPLDFPSPTKGQGLRPLSFGNQPGAVLLKREGAPDLLRNARSGTAPEAEDRVSGTEGSREWTEAAVPGTAAAQMAPLLFQMEQAERGTRFVQSQRRAFAVTLPESGGEPAGLNIESIDRAVERDARRYGGDFFLR